MKAGFTSDTDGVRDLDVSDLYCTATCGDPMHLKDGRSFRMCHWNIDSRGGQLGSIMSWLRAYDCAVGTLTETSIWSEGAANFARKCARVLLSARCSCFLPLATPVGC